MASALAPGPRAPSACSTTPTMTRPGATRWRGLADGDAVPALCAAAPPACCTTPSALGRATLAPLARPALSRRRPARARRGLDRGLPPRQRRCSCCTTHDLCGRARRLARATCPPDASSTCCRSCAAPSPRSAAGAARRSGERSARYRRRQPRDDRRRPTRVGSTRERAALRAAGARADPGGRQPHERWQTDERLRRWRLVLGGEADGAGVSLAGERRRAMDGAPGALRGRGTSRAASEARPRRVRAERRALARRHPDATSRPRVVQRHAAGRDRAARPAPDAARARVARDGRARRPPRRHARSSLARHARSARARRRGAVVRKVVEDLERRLASALRQAVRGSPRPRHPHAPPAAARRSTGTARSAPTCTTTIPRHDGRSPRGSSATAAGARRCATSILCVDQSGSMATLGRLLERLRRRHGVDAGAVDPAGRLRHRGRRPDRRARRSGRRAVRHPARRRHRHQPRRSPTASRSSRGPTRRSSCWSPTSTRAATPTRCSAAAPRW